MKTNLNIKDFKTIDISKLDFNNAFFHYTNINNVESIMKKGLEPRIGSNSLEIEKSKKVFFTMGFNNTLILMDAWIKWLVLRPKNNFIYKCGAYFMTKSYFPKIIVDTIFKTWIKSENRIKRSCKDLDNILKNSVFLVLDLKESIDFSFDDIDEVKNQKFSRKQLNYIYTYGSDSSDVKVEGWNMHTFSDKNIEKEKISIAKHHDLYSAKDMIVYMLKQIDIDIPYELPFLDYYVKNHCK